MSELRKNRYYRQKYDFENDPAVKKNFTTPMSSVKAKALDIIRGSKGDPASWEKLRDAFSFKYSISLILRGRRLWIKCSSA